MTLTITKVSESFFKIKFYFKLEQIFSTDVDGDKKHFYFPVSYLLHVKFTPLIFISASFVS